jgi:AAHS family 3-hydroxyphenylpropionic acid transporter
MTEPGLADTSAAGAQAGGSPPPYEPSRQLARATLISVVAILGYQGYTFATLGVGAPFIAKSFGLDQSGIARMFAWIAIDAFGVLIVSRMADQMGRRRILTWSLIATPLCAIGAALCVSQPWFIIFMIGMYSFIGATFASAIVMLAEALPVRRRARGQGYGGFSVGMGAALCVILMPWLARHNLSWRWLLAVPALGLVVVPFMVWFLPESRRWQEVSATGAMQRSRFYDVFGALHRRRTVPLMVTAFIGRIALTAVRSWQYYHAVTVIGLTPAQGSAVLLFGRGLAALGFPVGAWAAERFGRVPSITLIGIARTIGTVSFYWGPPRNFRNPVVWLGVSHCWYAALGAAGEVAGNAAVTELFPTALRSTIMGWITLVIAFAAIGSQITIATLAGPLGGLSVVVGYLALLEIPSAIIWAIFIDETRGMTLEAAAREHAVAAVENPA